jgi:hypothetical protein
MAANEKPAKPKVSKEQREWRPANSEEDRRGEVLRAARTIRAEMIGEAVACEWQVEIFGSRDMTEEGGAKEWQGNKAEESGEAEGASSQRRRRQRQR